MWSALALFAGLASQASAACNRQLLRDATAAYVQAQTAGKPSLPLLASNASYAENDTPMDITKGILAQPLTIDFSRSIYDAAECSAFTELTAATGAHPYIIHTRMTLAADEGKITAIESVVTDEGDWAFNATGHLYWTSRESWDAIPEGRRDSRAVIRAAVDAYLDNWGAPDLPVPHGTPCARLEGGGHYTGEGNLTSNTCDMGAFPKLLTVGRRRYVIDEEIGAVDVFNDFPWLEASLPANGSVPSSNFVRVEGGKIRYIHEVTVCKTPSCGR